MHSSIIFYDLIIIGMHNFTQKCRFYSHHSIFLENRSLDLFTRVETQKKNHYWPSLVVIAPAAYTRSNAVVRKKFIFLSERTYSSTHIYSDDGVMLLWVLKFSVLSNLNYIQLAVRMVMEGDKKKLYTTLFFFDFLFSLNFLMAAKSKRNDWYNIVAQRNSF